MQLNNSQYMKAKKINETTDRAKFNILELKKNKGE